MPRLNADMINDHAAEVVRRHLALDRGATPALPAEMIDSLSTYDAIQSYDRTRNAINFRAKCRRMGLPASVLMTLDREWEFVGQVNPAGQLRQDRVDTLCQPCRQRRNRNALAFPIISMDQFKLQTATHHCYVWHGECSECTTPHWCHSPITENE